MKKPYNEEASIRRVAPLLILLLAAIAMILAAVAALGRLWHVNEDNKQSFSARQMASAPLETAPQPVLQNYLKEKQKIASSYAWIDPAARLARIPIEEAMRAMALASKASPKQPAVEMSGTEAETTQNSGKQEAPRFQQRLGQDLPLQAAFVDARGKQRTLSEYFGHTPVVLVFGYYHCPRLCSTVMDGVLQSVRNAGIPHTIVGIGIDPRETPEDAHRKLVAYNAGESGSGDADGSTDLHLLTGKHEQILSLAQAAGFRYEYDKKSDQFSHPAGFLIATPDGRVSRYFSGVRFDRRDIRLALIDASNETVGSITEQVLLLCSHYDPLAGRYTLSVMNGIRIFAVLSVLLLIGGIWLVRRRARRLKADKTCPSGSRRSQTPGRGGKRI